MAKNKDEGKSEKAVSETDSSKRRAALDAALSKIDKQFGKGSAMIMGDKEVVPISAIPTSSLAVDIALGIGGLPRGRIIEIYGPESSGKTTLSLHAVANMQKLGGTVAFIDAEHALDPQYAVALGVDIDQLVISQPGTGEEALEIADMLIRSGAIDLIVVDSVAALTPRAELEGEMGDSHMGLQARLMSQGLRKLTGALSQSGTTMIFINQLRDKIGVMFGCFQYDTRVMLADGTTEKIGKIVNNKMGVDVLSFNPETNKIESRKIVNWFNNGKAESFLQFTVEKSSGNGRTQFAATPNHSIATSEGWQEAGDLKVGDSLLVSTLVTLSSEQQDMIKGSLMGDGALSYNRAKTSARFRLGHGIKQSDYLDWKVSLLDGVSSSRWTSKSGKAVFADFTPLDELSSIKDEVYSDGKKVFSKAYLESLSPLAWALWYMDDGSLAVRSEGKQKRTEGLSGRIQFCVEAMSKETQKNIVEVLNNKFGIEGTLSTINDNAILTFNRNNTDKFMALIANYIHPSMDYKLLPNLRGNFNNIVLEKIEPYQTVRPARILDIKVKPKTRSMNKFDIEVEGDHNYFVDGAMVHNSPETTTGGKALKFYASVRIDIRRIEALKDGDVVVGNRTKVKVVKNKVAPPFRTAEFDIIFGEGISYEGGIIDMGVQYGVINKSGAWFTYGTEQLGQGKEKARTFLKDNPDLCLELDAKIRDAAGLNGVVEPGVDDDEEAPGDDE
jgi:recombination protein RecA